MIRVMRVEHDFSELFVTFLLARSMRTQADLVDQLFNSSEKRLARILLLMAEFDKPGEPELLIPRISQATLAGLIGTTRSRVSFFMNRFRKLGFIKYNGRIQVNKSLLNVVLHDQLSGDNAVGAPIMNAEEEKSTLIGTKGRHLPFARTFRASATSRASACPDCSSRRHRWAGNWRYLIRSSSGCCNTRQPPSTDSAHSHPRLPHR